MVVKEFTHPNISSDSQSHIQSEEQSMNFRERRDKQGSSPFSSHKKSGYRISGKSFVIEEEILQMSNSIPGSGVHPSYKRRASSLGNENIISEFDCLSEGVDKQKGLDLEIISRNISKNPGISFSNYKINCKNPNFLTPKNSTRERGRKKSFSSFGNFEGPKVNGLSKLPISKNNHEDEGLFEPWENQSSNLSVSFPVELEIN